MSEARRTLPKELDAILGDFQGLLHRVGLSSDLDLPRQANSPHPVTDLESFRGFVLEYASETLLPVELPAICRSYFHATRYEGRELLALDRHLSADQRMSRFKRSSSEIGKAHLLNLRPLRENRLVQRYIGALEAGEVEAWHSLVYGVSLSIYSVPLRQGLLSYGQRVLDSFALSAITSLGLSTEEVRGVIDEISPQIPKQVEFLLRSEEGLFRAA